MPSREEDFNKIVLNAMYHRFIEITKDSKDLSIFHSQISKTAREVCATVFGDMLYNRLKNASTHQQDVEDIISVINGIVFTIQNAYQVFYMHFIQDGGSSFSNPNSPRLLTLYTELKRHGVFPRIPSADIWLSTRYEDVQTTSTSEKRFRLTIETYKGAQDELENWGQLKTAQDLILQTFIDCAVYGVHGKLKSQYFIQIMIAIATAQIPGCSYLEMQHWKKNLINNLDLITQELSQEPGIQQSMGGLAKVAVSVMPRVLDFMNAFSYRSGANYKR